MHRLNCWICTLLAAFFCFAFVPQAIFAADDSLGGPRAKTHASPVAPMKEALEQKDAQLKAEIAYMDARVDALNGEIAKMVVEIATGEETLFRHEQSVYVDAVVSGLSEQEMLEKLAQDFVYMQVALRIDAQYTQIESMVGERGQLELGLAEANAQLAVTKKPKGNIVAARATAREQALTKELAGLEQEIAPLRANADELKKEIAQLHANAGTMSAVLSVFVLVLVVLFSLFLALFFELGVKKRAVHERDMEILKLRNALDAILGVAARQCTSAYPPQKVAQVSETPEAPRESDKREPHL